MPNLYVTEQGAVIRKTSDRLVVEKDGEVLSEIPCLKVDTVFLYGNVQFTTQALVEMLDHGIELALFSISGRLRGQLTPPKAKNVELRMRQYELGRSREFCLAFAQEVVAGKIANSAFFLRRFHMNAPEAIPLAQVEAIEAEIRRAEACPSLEVLRGIEGAAAARYFELLARTIAPELGFEKRQRRPPRDPLNALLSFGYVVVGNELQSLLDGMGFDPYLGFLHQLDYGRPSLALDLLEEFRAALVDRFSVKLLNLGMLKGEDFVGDKERGVRLGEEARRRYFRAYEKELTTPYAVDEGKLTYRQLFRRQAERLARAIKAEEPYRSLRLPC